jgi:hypothetical protein
MVSVLGLETSTNCRDPSCKACEAIVSALLKGEVGTNQRMLCMAPAGEINESECAGDY